VKTVLILADWYLPGFRAGGPIRALAHLVEHLGDEFRFRILTRDRDLGASSRYPGITPGSWSRLGKADVLHLTPSEYPGPLLRGIPYDLLYLNSSVSPRYALGPLWRRRLGLLPDRPVLLAPRGEMSPAALSIKPARKRLHLALSRATGLYRDVLWQASAVPDRDDILRAFPGARVEIAPDLPAPLPSLCLREPKTPGRLRALFVARIAPIKNLEGALEALSARPGHDIRLTIVGPVEDSPYWETCRAKAQVPIDMLGPLPPDEVARTMARHDLLVLPSRGENFGHVIFEAMASGCPVLVSDRTPWRGLERIGAGWDIPLEDAGRMREIITSVAALDDAGHARLRQGARTFAETWLAQSGSVEQNRRLLRNALDT
jgi:glycosyltransferase involved in cell wall biosynthesis